MAGFINPFPGDFAVPITNELGADFSAVITVPTYATLMSLTLTPVQPSSYLWFLFTCSWLHVGGFAGNAAFNVRFRLNGSLLTGGATDNQVRSQIGTLARQRRVVIAGTPQTLDVEISKFGAVGNALQISPVALPDLMHANLTMEEQA